jgi:hypothetical protein
MTQHSIVWFQLFVCFQSQILDLYKIQFEELLSSMMLRRVALVRTHVSEEYGASFIRVTRIGVLGTTLAVTSSRRTLLLVTASVVPSSPILPTVIKKALTSYETSVACFGC